MKKLFSLVLALSMALALTACGGSADTDSTTTDDTAETTAKPVELYVFAAASMQESLDQVIEAYKAVAPEVAVVATYDSSGTLKTQIQEGADCDVFISAAPKQMNQLDAEGGEEKIRYGIGLSYGEVQGVMKGSDRQTIGGNIDLILSLIHI